MKKLQSVPKYYNEHQPTCNILIKYIWWSQNFFIFSWIGKQLIACVRTAHRCNQSSSNIHDDSCGEAVNNINLKTLTILVKRLILDAWLSPGCASADDTLQFLKFKRRYVKMEDK